MLGSLPGSRSLAEARYYAYPQNQFWRLMEQVIAAPLQELDYGARLSRLQEHGVGLWDTVGQARRPGSLDSAISDIVPNDLAALVGRLPALRGIGTNGGLASKLARQALPEPAVELVALPSSSPALTWPFERKLERWLELRRFL